MKKRILWALALVLILSSVVWAQEALPSPQQVKLNGEKVAIAAYNIEDENYFRLRDLAAVLKETSGKFNVVYSDTNQAVTIFAKEDYTGDDKALASLEPGIQEAVISTHKLMLGADELHLKAYNVNGNNFYRLRDLAGVLDFNVDYDAVTNAVLITTAYTDKVPVLVNDKDDEGKLTFTTKPLVVEKKALEDLDIEAALKEAPKDHPLEEYKWTLRAEKGELEINFDAKTQGIYELHATITQEGMRDERVTIKDGVITQDALRSTSADLQKPFTVVVQGLDVIHPKAPLLTLVEYNVGK